MKLSDFKDEKAIEVVANLLTPITSIAKNKDNRDAKEKSVYAFAQSVLLNNAKDVMAIFAILNDEDPESYHCTAATVLADTIELFTDPDMLSLFGLQSQTSTSSGSASMNGGVEEE